MKKIDQLTATRFLASMLIILHHLGGRHIPVLRPIVSLAVYSIGFFFVLSGFVMTMVYFHPDRPFSVKDFWVARISRIYPVYLFSFALTSIYYAEALGKMKSGEYLSSVLLFQGWIPRYALTMNFPAWTLSVEMFFYLVFPLVIYLMRRAPASRLIWTSLIVWAVIQSVRQIVIHGPMGVDVNFTAYFPLFHIDSFLIGMAAGMWYLKVGSRLEVSQRMISLILFSCLAIFLASHFLGATEFFGSFHGFFSPLFAIIILMLSLDRSFVSRILSNKWLVVLGESSYSLYIIHVPVLWLFGNLIAGLGIPKSPNLMFGVYLPLAILLSVLVFRWIEWPAQNWLRHNSRKLLPIALDIILIGAAIYLAFMARLGPDIGPFQRPIRFAVRAGIPLLFGLLIVFGYYALSVKADGSAWRKAASLFLPLLIGFFLLGVAMNFATGAGWIESYPRTFLPIGFVIAAGLLHLSQLFFNRQKVVTAT